jgi:hypothetical protein
MKTLQIGNHVLISLFATASGLFKVFGGAADLQVFGHLGMGPLLVGLFGALQAAAGLGLQFNRSARAAAVLLVLCNAVATAGLFAAGVQPFGFISFVFIAMAAAELRWPGWAARREPATAF